MPLVATLVTDPSNPVLSQSLAQQATKAVASLPPVWLADGIACDIEIPPGKTADEVHRLLSNVFEARPVDIVIQESVGRKKRLLIADMDSTMIAQECIDELAAEAGFYDRVAAVTRRAMNGEIEFEAAVRERVALLKGLETDVVDRVLRDRITLTPGGPQLLATMKANGAYAALVSGGFTVFTSRIAEILGFDEHRANTLQHSNGVFDGTVAEPILGQQAKVDALQELIRQLGITAQETMAVGDGANDLGMLGIAGSGVALHAKPRVAAKAKMRVDHGDLTALLYIQGYKQDEFAET
ncbi:phosphoserine phosphatase SerB [Hoeflea prorocentri]|uniref:Phosphoserine phosphatase n=1 Tax=Hoeflea prorocentri TaxID=1922333 RepID=A0A9X3UFK2_9HYPH|nr:phosphoserine phosphatase SerB [Hoeflea prorocentri]MCY6379975.1 phosphoserine phosphatase SerB [Hoeflea prorocentri]MDA5397775.1 phosphoserine phosphatase SerB [Hoeflea prorocentri]